MKNKVLTMACGLFLLQSAVFAQDASKAPKTQSAKVSPKTVQVHVATKAVPKGVHMHAANNSKKS